MKKNEILPFATTWMDLEGIMLSEVSQTKTNNAWYPFYVESQKKKKRSNSRTESRKVVARGLEVWEIGRGW